MSNLLFQLISLEEAIFSEAGWLIVVCGRIDLMDQIAQLQKRIFQNKKKKGFNTEDEETELLFIAEELGEAVSASRKGKKRKLAEEAVDIIIYCLGLLSILKIDASKEIEKKVKKNEGRNYNKSKKGFGFIEKNNRC